MSVYRSLIPSTANPLLEQALRDKLQRRRDTAGSLGELEPLALRLGLMQSTLKPRLLEPQLVVVASDHGLAVDGIALPEEAGTADQVGRLLSMRSPLYAFARHQGLQLTVVDAGVAERLAAHDQLLMRKIAHGTRNARVGPAMTIDQAHAAIRAGMEISDNLRGTMLACAGLGVGSHLSAALVLSRLSDVPVREFLIAGPQMNPDRLAHLQVVAHGAQGRHQNAADPIDALAAFGGFEIAMLVGLILVAAQKRHLIVIDGMAACAALLIASRVAEGVVDYCLFARSHNHLGLDQALRVFRSSALLELGMDTCDGTGAVLAWPLIRSAASLLTDVTESDDAGTRAASGEDAVNR